MRPDTGELIAELVNEPTWADLDARIARWTAELLAAVKADEDSGRETVLPQACARRAITFGAVPGGG